MKSSNSDSIVQVSEIDLIGMLRRRWPKIVFGVGVGLFLAALYYVTASKTYESKIEILVGQRNSEVTNNGTLNSANASGDAIHEDQLATHMRLLVSRKMLAEGIRRGNLSRLASFRRAAAQNIDGVDHILKNIEVQRGGEGEASDAMVLRASYRDTNPEHAALVLSAVYESYREYVESHGQNSTQHAVELIEEARKTHEEELNAAESAYREFVKSVPVLMEGEKVQDIHKDRLGRLEVELNEVRTSLAGSRSRLEVIQNYFADRTTSVVANLDHLALLSEKEVTRLKLFLDMTRGEVQSAAFQADQPIRQEAAKAQYNRLLELMQRERTFSESFGPGHPMVKVIRNEIEITQNFLLSHAPEDSSSATKKIEPAEMLTTYISLLQNDISELEKRLTYLMAEADREMMLAKQVENDFLKGNALRTALKRAQTRYDEVIRRLQELQLSRSYAGFSTDLLASPAVPKSAAWPKLPIVGILGLLIGTTIGLLLATFAEISDSTFCDATDLEKAIGAPAIAHVPRFELADFRDQIQANSMVQPSLLTFHAPRSPESEVYRVARTALMISNRKGDVQTIMMTSPQPGDGKSTTISNLGISFARTGKRVLLIDADMRRPVVSTLFGIDNEPGLSDVLSGSIAAREAIQTTEVADLDVIANGSPTSSPAELLESPRFAMLLAEMSQRYDLVLVDAPPLLAVADPAIIAPLVDSVILTVRVKKNGRGPVQQATKILKDLEVTPSAVVVNGVDKEATAYGYGSKYSRDDYRYVSRYHNGYAAQEENDSRDENKNVKNATPAPAAANAFRKGMIHGTPGNSSLTS